MSRIPTYLQVAGRNLAQNWRRTLTATGGIAFAILLVFMQLGFLQAARRGATLIYTDLDFDAAILSGRYQSIAQPGTIDRTRLAQALSVAGVMEVAPVYVRNARWRNQATDDTASIMLLGLPSGPGWLANPDLRAGVGVLARNDAILIDELSHRDFGDIATGSEGEINGQRFRIGGRFAQGMSMFSEGAAALSPNALERISPGASVSPTLGLVRVSPGADARAVVTALAAALPADTLALTRADLIQRDQDFFVKVKPVGMVFQVGVFVALVVGAVILFQVLSTEIANRLREYATMKAMGLSNAFIYRIGVSQAVLFGAMGYFPALFGAWCIYAVVRYFSRLPMLVTLPLATQVAAMALGLCTLSSFMALRRVRQADPAELF